MRPVRWTLLILATLFSFAASFAAELDPCPHHAGVAADESSAHAGHGDFSGGAPDEDRPCTCPGPCSPVSAPALPGTAVSARAAPVPFVVAPPAPDSRIPQPAIAFLLPWPNAPPLA